MLVVEGEAPLRQPSAATSPFVLRKNRKEFGTLLHELDRRELSQPA